MFCIWKNFYRVLDAFLGRFCLYNHLVYNKPCLHAFSAMLLELAVSVLIKLSDTENLSRHFLNLFLSKRCLSSNYERSQIVAADTCSKHSGKCWKRWNQVENGWVGTESCKNWHLWAYDYCPRLDYQYYVDWCEYGMSSGVNWQMWLPSQGEEKNHRKKLE